MRLRGLPRRPRSVNLVRGAFEVLELYLAVGCLDKFNLPRQRHTAPPPGPYGDLIRPQTESKVFHFWSAISFF